MPFREKSAWAMSVVMLVTGIVYAYLASQALQGPVIAPVIPYVILVVVLSVVAQVLLAIMTPREATAPADEREKLVIAKAGHWSGMVLAFAVLLAAAVYVVHPNGNMLFHHVIGALIIGQLAEYLLQIAFFRNGALHG